MAMHLAAADAKRKRNSATAAEEPKASRPRLSKADASRPVVNVSSPSLSKPRTQRPSPGDLKALMHQLISPASAAQPLAGRDSIRSPQQQRRQQQLQRSAHFGPAASRDADAAPSLASTLPNASSAAHPVSHKQPQSSPAPRQTAAAFATEPSLSAANVAWQVGKQKQRKKVLSRMQPHATSNLSPAASPAAESAPSVAPPAHDALAKPSAAELATPADVTFAQGSSLTPNVYHQREIDICASSDQLRQAVLKKHALGQLPLVQDPKVASSDSTDSVIAFPSRHMPLQAEPQENGPSSSGSQIPQGKPSGRWRPSESRGAAALSFLAAAGPALQQAANPKDAYWSGLSDADIANANAAAG